MRFDQPISPKARVARLLGAIAIAIAIAINTPSIAQQAPTADVVASESASQARWIPTGNLNVARSGHTATLLSDGKVLVVGGTLSGLEAELFDPTANTWTRTGDAACTAGGVFTAIVSSLSSATLLSDGKVLVAGGGCSELYDPATGTWTLTGQMNVVRWGHTANRLADGRVLVARRKQGGGLVVQYYRQRRDLRPCNWHVDIHRRAPCCTRGWGWRGWRTGWAHRDSAWRR